MGYQFTLRIDDKNHSLTKENGIPIAAIGEILAALSNAIGDSNSKIVLSEIRGNCYAMQFYTEEQSVVQHFEELHSNLATKDQIEWTPEEREYAKVVRRTIKNHKVYFEALDGSNKRLSIIKDFKKNTLPTHYHERKTIYGRIIQVGSRSKENPYQIVIQDYDGENYTLRLEKEDDAKLAARLSEVYRKLFIRFVITAKISLVDESIDYKLVDFTIPTSKSLFESALEAQEDELGFDFNIEDLNKLRNNAQNNAGRLQ